MTLKELKQSPKYHDGSAMLGLVMTLILTSLAVWLVLSVQRAHADTKTTKSGTYPYNSDIDCSTCCRYENNQIVKLSKAECDAVNNDLNWAEAIKTAQAHYEAQIKISREREDLLLKEVKLLNYQISVLTNKVMDDQK